MSRLIQQPINQVKLTNVAVVKLQLQGKRFEIACYRNKIMDYRSGHETDMSEVLQSDRVFVNVSKGQFAKSDDLRKVFDSTDQEAIAKIILNHPKSIIQVSDKERELQQADCLARIATWMANHCVYRQTQRPVTVAQVQQALGGFNVQPHKPLKKQYLDAFKYLKQHDILDIERAKMELLLSCETSAQEAVLRELHQLDPPPKLLMIEQPPQNASNAGAVVVIRLHADPSLYRSLDQLVQSLHAGKLEIVHQQVVGGGGDGIDNASKLVANFPSSREDQSMSVTSLNAAEKMGTSTTSQQNVGDSSDAEEMEGVAGSLAGVSLKKDNEDSDDDSDESDQDEAIVAMSRKQLRQQQKKQSKLSKRQQPTVTSGTGPVIENPSSIISNPPTASSSSSKPISTTDPNAKSCNTCGGSFASAAAYRTHFKSDWHRYNQKLKLQGQPPVSEQEFDLVDADAFFTENL